MRKLIIVTILLFCIGGVVMAQYYNGGRRLYCPTASIIPVEGKYLLFIGELKESNDGICYTTNPPMCSAYRVYKVIQFDSMELLKKEINKYQDENVVAIIQVGKVFNIARIEREVEEKVKKFEFDKFEIMEKQ